MEKSNIMALHKKQIKKSDQIVAIAKNTRDAYITSTEKSVLGYDTLRPRAC